MRYKYKVRELIADKVLNNENEQTEVLLSKK